MQPTMWKLSPLQLGPSSVAAVQSAEFVFEATTYFLSKCFKCPNLLQPSNYRSPRVPVHMPVIAQRIVDFLVDDCFSRHRCKMRQALWGSVGGGETPLSALDIAEKVACIQLAVLHYIT